jgi:hypothetical protein
MRYRSASAPRTTLRVRGSVAAGALALIALIVLVPGGAAARRSASAPPQRPASTTTPSMPAATTTTPAMSATIRTTPAMPAAVPAGFVGIDADGPVFGSGNTINFDRQVDSMVANGVQSIRVAFSWAAAEPYETWSKVPAVDRDEYVNVNGKPFRFSQIDQIVGAAAQHDVTVLPTVLYTPSWDARNNKRGPVNTPERTGPYGTYLTALIVRYGPHGSFWKANPQIRRLPIRSWQIWNEENLSYYWPQPYASGYVKLLRTAHTAIRKADPGAKVVLGALTNLAWKSIGQIYRIAGARNLFDVASVNGFTKLPANVILYLRFTRNAMSHFKDGTKPLLATEISWPSAQGKSRQKFDFDTTEGGQARNIAALMPLIGASYKSLRLAGFDYYTWMGDEGDKSSAFDFAGLLRFHDDKVTVKPALSAFRRGALALERCKRKGPLASSCIT